MKAIRRTILVLGAVAVAAVCVAQTPANKPKPQANAVVAVPVCNIKLVTMASATAPGEPVPGAEILIEQGNAEARVAHVTTDSNGCASFVPTAPGNVKFTVKWAPAQITKLRQAAPQAEKVQMVLKVTVGKKTTEHKAEVMLKGASTNSSGPFSQALSNIEDNG